MSKLSSLMGQPTIIKLSNGDDFPVFALYTSDEAEFAQLQLDKKHAESIKFLLVKTIKYAIPDVTQEEIERLNSDDKNLILKTAMYKNGLKLDNKNDSPN